MITKQRTFTRETIKLLHLSPYVVERKLDHGIIMFQYLYGIEVFINVEKAAAGLLIDKLQEGITFEDLSQIVNQHLNIQKSDDFIYTCMQKGIIE